MARHPYHNWPQPMPMGLVGGLTHPLPPHKLSIVKTESAFPKDVFEQIKSDVAFAKSQSKPTAEAAVVTHIKALETLVNYVEALTDPTTQKVLNAYQDMIADPDLKASFVASIARELEFEDGKLLRLELFKRTEG